MQPPALAIRKDRAQALLVGFAGLHQGLHLIEYLLITKR
jgi:hypothetical protein